MGEHRSSYVPAIDGLRAIAVVAVVAYHAGLPLPAGFVGVDIFFVISGYLITRLLHDEVQATGRIDFTAFYARRARRILPAVTLVVLVTLGLMAILSPGNIRSAAMSAASAASFVANFYFQATTGGYWDQTSESLPLLHLWSLSVEEQFYLIWPLLMRWVRTWRGLALVVIASFVGSELMLASNPEAAFFQMPARAWELAVGGLVAIKPVRLPRGLAWAGLVLVLASTAVPFAHFPGVGALPAVLGGALLIAGVQNGQRVALLEAKPIVFVGLISYSLYLWHWPLLAMDALINVGPSPLPVRLAICAISVALAAASYRYVETPFRRSRRASRKVLVFGGSTIALLACSAFAIGKMPTNETPADIVARDWPATRAKCHQLNISAPVEISPTCQNKTRKADAVIWGDSMALAWQPFVAERSSSVIELSRDSCPPFDPGTSTRATRWCGEFGRMALEKAKTVDAVYLAAAWRSHDISKLEPTLAALHGRKVFIIGPTPLLPATVPACMRASNIDRCYLPRQEFERQISDKRQRLKEVAAKYGATFIDPTDYFCAGSVCGAYRGQTALYWDDQHVSSTAAREFSNRHPK